MSEVGKTFRVVFKFQDAFNEVLALFWMKKVYNPEAKLMKVQFR